MTYLEHGQLKNALESIKKSLDTHFNSKMNEEKYEKKDLADVYYNKGLILKHLKKFVDAKEAFEEANKLVKGKQYLKEIKEVEKLLKN